MSNHRSDCYYCKTSVLSRDLGSHILRKHEKELFSDKDNLKGLYRDKYFKEPLHLSIGVDSYHFCLTDKSCIRKSITALQHFKGKAEKHREAIIALREKYPLEGGTEAAPVAAPLLTDKEKRILQDDILDLISQQQDDYARQVGPWAFSKKSSAILKRLGLLSTLEDLQEEYPNSFTVEEKEEEQEEQQEQEEAPLPPDEPEETEPEPERYIPPPPLVHTSSHYSIPKPKTDPQLFRQQPAPPPSFSSMKIIQSTKRPLSSGAL